MNRESEKIMKNIYIEREKLEKERKRIRYRKELMAAVEIPIWSCD